MEGIFSLMQMAKTSAVLAQLARGRAPLRLGADGSDHRRRHRVVRDARRREPGGARRADRLRRPAGDRADDQAGAAGGLPDGGVPARARDAGRDRGPAADEAEIARLLRHMLGLPAPATPGHGNGAAGPAADASDAGGADRPGCSADDRRDPLGAGDGRGAACRCGRPTPAFPFPAHRGHQREGLGRRALRTRRCARRGGGGSGSTPRRTWSTSPSGSGSTGARSPAALVERRPSACARRSSGPAPPSSRRPPRSPSSASPRRGWRWRWWRWGWAGGSTPPTSCCRTRWRSPTWRATTPSTWATIAQIAREKAGILKPGSPRSPARGPGGARRAALGGRRPGHTPARASGPRLGNRAGDRCGRDRLPPAIGPLG
jgi:hypothetical protein